MALQLVGLVRSCSRLRKWNYVRYFQVWGTKIGEGSGKGEPHSIEAVTRLVGSRLPGLTAVQVIPKSEYC